MKLIILSLFLISTLADKLQNNYLPPSNARTAGGSDFLSAPSRDSNVFATSRFRTNGPASPSGSSNPFASPSFARSNLNSFNTPVSKSASFRSSETYSGSPIPILRSSSDNNGDGSYRFAYETDNRISQEEEGHLENIGTDNEANTVRGSYSFQSPDGQIFTVNYIADENGFRAFGDHLPTAPPVPEDIQRSLVNVAAEKYNENGESGHSYDYGRSGSRAFNFDRATQKNSFGFNRGSQRTSYNSGASSRNSQEFDDLNGVEVGTPEAVSTPVEIARPEQVDISRQYLAPNIRPLEGGYRY